MLSRPRSNLEALGVVMMAENPAFGAGTSRYIVKRDVRGLAAVPLVNGTLPAPFVDNDSDGLPDIDAFDQFVSSNKAAPPSPFFAVDAPTQATAYDGFSRSLSNNALLYGYIDTTHTFTAAMLDDLGPLVNPDITQDHESLMYMLGGAYVMLGTRDGGNTTQRLYGDAQSGQATISYDAFHPEDSPLVDLIYATSADPRRRVDGRHARPHEVADAKSSGRSRAPDRRGPRVQERREQTPRSDAAGEVDVLGRDPRRDGASGARARLPRGHACDRRNPAKATCSAGYLQTTCNSAIT